MIGEETEGGARPSRTAEIDEKSHAKSQGAEEKKNSHKRAQRTQKEQRAKRQDEQSISLDYVVDGEF